MSTTIGGTRWLWHARHADRQQHSGSSATRHADGTGEHRPGVPDLCRPRQWRRYFVDLNPQLNALSTAQTNINEATGSMQVTQSAMTQIQQIAATFVSDMPNLNGLNSQEVDSVAANAQQALTQVANLLDTQDGNSYVFGGQDSSNPPVPSPDDILSSGFYTQINAAVSALSANGAAATTSATLSIAGSNATGTSPFSAYMSQPTPAISAPIVETGEGGTVQTGLLASANSVAVSTGTSTTGSYMRDLLRALATMVRCPALRPTIRASVRWCKIPAPA